MDLEIDSIGGSKSPIIDGNEVTFIFKGNAQSVYLAGDYNQWELQDNMIKVPNNDLWYIKKNFPENSRFDYKYIVDGNWITDPLNENVTPGGAGANSTLIMPEYMSEYSKIINEDVPRGTTIKNQKYYSNHLGFEMNYHIYLPFDYDKGSTNYILYAMDGIDYLNFGKINLILDYMIHNVEIPNLVAVLVDPHDRNTEYTIHEPYYNYVLKELMPYVENKYMDTAESIARSAIGVSWGGLTSVYLAVNAPDKFNGILSQSGSFWPKDWLIFDMIKKTETNHIKFVLQTGTIQDTEEMNDSMVMLLKSKGYSVDYMKYAESHSWGNWKGHLNEGLKQLYLNS